jgi:hypothetical protein
MYVSITMTLNELGVIQIHGCENSLFKWLCALKFGIIDPRRPASGGWVVGIFKILDRAVREVN